MSNCLLSIVTVTRNCATTIARTLSSVESVKSLGVEYLVIDGLSTDGTLDIIRSHGDLVDRLVSEPDTGIYNAMNKGVRLARGRYVLFINGDDEIVSDNFSLIMKAMAHGIDEIICATTIVGKLTSPTETLVAKPWRLPFFNSIPHPSSFVRRELLLRSPFREDLRIVSDYDFFLGAYLARHSFCVIPVVTALHKRDGASADIHRSQSELDRVRRERLGWSYPMLNIFSAFYRQVKHLLGIRPE